MAKTGFIATAMLETSKGSIQPGDVVKGLPAVEMKHLKKLGVVKEGIINEKNEDSSSQEDQNSSQEDQNDGDGSSEGDKDEKNGDK